MRKTITASSQNSKNPTTKRIVMRASENHSRNDENKLAEFFEE
jgi:hypothetical protein